MSNNNLPSTDERLSTEVDLLNAMYPDQIIYYPKSNELKFIHETGSTLVLRIPETYPTSGLPDIITADNPSKEDLRQEMKTVMMTTSSIHLPPGEEILDSIIQIYQDLIINSDNDNNSNSNNNSEDTNPPTITSQPKQQQNPQPKQYKTVIIWLHHLLSTTKRKLALNPTLSSSSSPSPFPTTTTTTSSTTTHINKITGSTKPGYPGILLFTGPTPLINAHILELKSQKWQAFQIRYEEESDSIESVWEFEHNTGQKQGKGKGKEIVEFETLGEMVRDIIVGEGRREVFLRGVGVK